MSQNATILLPSVFLPRCSFSSYCYSENSPRRREDLSLSLNSLSQGSLAQLLRGTARLQHYVRLVFTCTSYVMVGRLEAYLAGPLLVIVRDLERTHRKHNRPPLTTPQDKCGLIPPKFPTQLWQVWQVWSMRGSFSVTSKLSLSIMRCAFSRSPLPKRVPKCLLIQMTYGQDRITSQIFRP